MKNAEPKGALIGHIRTAIAHLLGAEPASIAAAARTAGFSVRTFQRRLAEAGPTYSQLLDEVRFAEARRRISDPRVRVKAVATALGFVEPASFTRAFRRWTGLSPREYRRRLRGLDRVGRSPAPRADDQIAARADKKVPAVR